MSPTSTSTSSTITGDKPKARRLLMKQPIMTRMLIALAPLALAGVYFFGWRVAGVLATVFAAGLTSEYVTSRRRGQPVSTACFVTCALYGLALPPTTPMWIAAVGAVVAILFGKEVFGGFGRNPFNPAIVGRAFVYICFPVELTSRFVPSFQGWPGGFAQWSFESLHRLPSYLAESGRGVADAISQASPMWIQREFGQSVSVSARQLALGNIGGLFEADGARYILAAGSIGEACAVLIVLGAVYLLATRTANWRLMLPALGGLVLANVLFRNLLGFAGAGEVPPLHVALLAGPTLYVVVFMITEPVSAPNKKPAQMMYSFLIGFLIVVLRWRVIFVAAATFAILLGNLVGPLLDMAATEWAARKKTKGASAAPAGEGAS